MVVVCVDLGGAKRHQYRNNITMYLIKIISMHDFFYYM